MLPAVTGNISKIGFCHIVQKGWLRDGISWSVSDLSELLSWLCTLYGSVLSKDFLQDLSFQLERFVVSYEFSRNSWGEGLIMCYSLSGSALLSKINSTPFLGTILWIRQWSWSFVCWNWICNRRFRFTRCRAPLTVKEYLRPANLYTHRE